MADDPSILKEFLVALGFQVDEAKLKRFNGQIAAAEKAVGEFSLAMTAAAGVVEAAVLKVSRQFEALYYATQNLNASAENITAFTFAVGQIGGTADAAKGSLGNLAEFMRRFPGGEGYLRSLGVQTRDASGNLRDMTGIIQDVGAAFRKMSYPAAKARADLLGIDDATFKILLWRPNQLVEQMQAAQKAIAASGLSMKDAAEASAKFDQAVRMLKLQVELLIDRVVLGLQGQAGQALQRFGDMAMRLLTALGTLTGKALGWFGKLDHATRGWSTSLIVLAGVLTPIIAFIGWAPVAIGAVATAIVALIDDFQTWRAGGKSLIDWGQWSDEIDNALGGFKDLGDALKDLWTVVGPVATKIAKAMGSFVGELLKGGLRELADLLHAIADSVRLITDLLTGNWTKAWADAKRVAVDTLKGLVDLVGAVINSVHALWDALHNRKPQAANPTGPSAQAHAAATGQPAPHAPAANDKSAAGAFAQVAAFFRQQGWSDEASRGIAAGVGAESGFNAGAVNPTSGAYGLAQWLKARRADFAKLFGHDIKGSTMAEQLKFIQHELVNGAGLGGRAIAGAKSATEALQAFVGQYERPAPGKEYGGDISRGLALLAANSNVSGAPLASPGALASAPRSVSITQKTDIHVTGGDAASTGRAVASEQGRVNADLVRNARSAVG